MTKWDNAISCIGDSLTENDNLGVPAHLMWPGKLQASLNGLGANCVCRNFGRSGNTTAQMVTRFSRMTQFSIPKIGIIFGGVNDPGASITQAQTQANIESMITSLQNAGVSRIMVIIAHYLNFSTGGDTLTTPYASYVSVRNAQQAAANAHTGVVFVDLYNYFRNRIVNGQDTQGSFSWHVADANQHFNAYGANLVAQCILASIQAQGWDALLK